MSAHTPGPWVVSEYMDDGRLGVLSGNNEILCSVSVGLREADARLIAAAPELLSALNLLLDTASLVAGQSSMGHLLKKDMERARAALAKAGLV